MLNGVSGMVGETAVVTKELAGPHQPGSVLARGEEWFARAMFPGTRIAPGTEVVVADVERGLLVCYPAEAPIRPSAADTAVAEPGGRGRDGGPSGNQLSPDALCGGPPVPKVSPGGGDHDHRIRGSGHRSGGGGVLHLRPHRRLPEVVPQGGPAGLRRGGQAVRRVQDDQAAGAARPDAPGRPDGQGRRPRVPTDRRPAGGHHQGQRVAVGQRHHLLPGNRREARPVRGERLRPRHRPDGPDRAARRVRRADPRRVAVRARDDQRQDAGPHGRGHASSGASG